MIRFLTYLFLTYLFFSCSKPEKVESPPEKNEFNYYFGEQVKDSYRYMENLQDSSLISWLKLKNKESSVISMLKGRKALLEKINKSKDNNSSISKIIRTYKDSYFYLKSDSKNKNAKLFYKKSLQDTEEVLYNPDLFKASLNKGYVINYIKPSWDGSKIAISLTESDKEISEIIILDVASRKIEPQVIDHCWPSGMGGIQWLPDNSGFIYIYIPNLDKNSKEYLLNTSSVLYKLGNPSNKLKTLFSKEKNTNFSIKEEDFCKIKIGNQTDKYIFSLTSGATTYQDHYYALIDEVKKENINWEPLFTKENLIKKFLIKENEIIYMTSKKASNFKICKTSLKSPNFYNPEILVEEDSLATITDMAITKGALFFVKTKNGVEAKLYKQTHDKEITEIKLPKASGYVNVTSKGFDYEDFWINIEGWISKKERYKFDFIKEEFTKVNIDKSSNNAIGDVIIEEIEIPSHDGTMVPLSIIYKKGIKINKEKRLLISAYGAYGISGRPFMYPILKHWVALGGVYAEAHVRGGGEKGNEWYKGGYKTTKENTWKDLNACTEYLIKHNYSSVSKIAAWSASAGGICVGKAVTERPDLYSAVMIRSGVFNTLRSENSANGKNNMKEYGTVKDSIEFKALYKMDTYHSIKNNVKYPAILLTAGMNDARVSASHSAKLIARLQESNIRNTAFLSLDFEGGHSFDATQDKKNKETADFISFALWQTGHPDYQLK